MTVALRALDTNATPDLAAVKAWGASVVGLYLGRNLTRQVAEQAAALDMGVLSIWETQADAPMGGVVRAGQDATCAQRAAHGVGQPCGSTIVYTNDEVVVGWPRSLESRDTLAYFFALPGVKVYDYDYSASFYGQSAIWQDIADEGYVHFFHAPDGAPTSPGDSLMDVGAVTLNSVVYDIDQLEIQTCGAWNANGLWPPIIAPPIAKEGDMFPLFIRDTKTGACGQVLGNGQVINLSEFWPAYQTAFAAAKVPMVTVEAEGIFSLYEAFQP